MSDDNGIILIPQEFVPISGLNPLFHNVSGARQAMFTGNLSQMLIVEGRTRARIQSGLEREVSKATFSHTFPRDAIVLAVIPRFSGQMYGEEFGVNPMDIVIYEDYHTRQLDVLELSKFHVMHQHYGFQFEYDQDVYDKLIKGAKFQAGTQVARSPAVTPDGDYMYGLETNVVMITDPAVTEDGVKYSRSYANRIRSDAFETRVITCGRSHYPINFNGNAEEYKPIPDVGDLIQSNGLICALRPFDSKFDPAYMTRKRLFKPVYGLDIPTYGAPDAEVVDIRVLHNDRLPNPRLPDEMTKQFRKYYEADRRFYTDIVKACLCRNGGKMSMDVDMSDRLRSLLFEAIARAGDNLVTEGIWPKNNIDELNARKNYRGEMLDEYRVEITYRYKTSTGEGPKVSDIFGGKGVCVDVEEDENMPIDDFGIRAEVAIFDASTVNRQNNGRQHCQVIGAAGRDIIRRIRASYDLPELGVVPEAVARRAVLSQDNVSLGLKNFAYLMGFYHLVSPKGNFAALSKPTVIPSGRHLSHLISVIQDGNEPHGLYLQMVSDSGVKMCEIIEAIENGPYMPNMSPITYKDYAGNWVRTLTPILIGPNYYLTLEKTATDWSGVGSSKVNHFGVTARLTNADKHSSPGRQTVTRSTGESEARNHAQAMGAWPVANIMDMNNNPVNHREVCNNIMTAEFPTNIEEVLDRTKFKFGGHRPQAYARHQFVCSGKDISRA